MFYRCYIHSVGGGVECVGPLDFSNEDNAIDYAYQMAIEDYCSFEGLHGIPSYEDIIYCPEDYGLDAEFSEQDLIYTYEQIRENYLDYWIERAKDENDVDEDYQ